MKIYKTLRKRGLALFLALTMCLSLIQTTAFANEEAEHVHNEGGWTCAYTDPVTEPACVHEHDAACGYVEAVEEIPCVCTGTDEEGGVVHEDGCAYAPAVEGAPCGHVCGGECAAVVTEGFWECTPPAGEPEDTEPTEDAEAPAEVQAFLDAVAAIPEITAENAAEVAEYVYGPVSEAYDALLGTEYEERDDVMEAAEVYAAAIEAVDAALEMDAEAYLDKIPGYTPVDKFYYGGKEVAHLYVGIYPNNPVYKYKNPATSIEIQVGEIGFDQRLYTKSATCYCGNVLVEETPDWIAVDSNRKLTSSDATVVSPSDIKWSLAGYEATDWSDHGYEGYPALQLDVTGVKPGETSINFQAYQNYYYYYTWQQCSVCRQVYSEISFLGKWIEDTETINVTVNADYVLNYDANGGNVTPSSDKKTVASTTCSFDLPTPTREGYTFKGWAETSNAANGVTGSYTLDWEEGFGSKANPVTKTLYAVWEEDSATETYTVKYVDGVGGEAFGDETHGNLRAGDNTPSFNGKTERTGYTFMGWSPTVNPVVSSEDAD